MTWAVVVLGLLGLLAAVTAAQGSDQAMAWDREIVASGVKYRPVIGDKLILAPSDRLPAGMPLQDSNNNCGIFVFNDRLFMGFRTSRSHFASAKAQIHVVSIALSEYRTGNWSAETTLFLESDVREPNFHVAGGLLVFSFFQAGTNPFAFEPQALWRTERLRAGVWTQPQIWGRPEEVLWDIAFHDGVGLLTSYQGNHYDPVNFPAVHVFLNVSRDDGRTWQPLAPRGATPDVEWVYLGGASEVGFTVDVDNNFWAVTRNEDGDNAGWGSFLVFAPNNDWGTWQLFPSANRTFPDIYESPKMFRHGGEVYLIARTDPDGPYDMGFDGLTFNQQRAAYLAAYSLRSHGTGLWRVDQATKTLQFVTTLPGCGDTAFPSIVRVGKHKLLVANYTNPTELCAEWSWLRGQVSLDGTYVYVLEIDFVPSS